MAQTGVEGADVVVLQIHLDEGFPVVVAVVHLHPVQRITAEVQRLARAHVGQVGGDVAAVVFKQQAVPGTQRVVFEVQARVLGKVRRAQQLAAGGVSPAVHRTHDVARGAGGIVGGVQVAAPLEHHGLAVPAYIRDQLHPLGGAHQGPALALLGQGRIVAQLGHAQFVPHIAGPALKDGRHLALKQRRVKVAGNW